MFMQAIIFKTILSMIKGKVITKNRYCLVSYLKSNEYEKIVFMRLSIENWNTQNKKC